MASILYLPTMRILLFLLVSTLSLNAQNWHPPMDPPMILSGSFGELRSNHFHSGIDIKTGGVVGKSVYAVERGTVVRIRVGPTGFGKALYLRHPNGKTSVYAHLNAFDPAIAEYVKKAQYRQQRFAVDLYPEAGTFSFERGEEIAKSGNSGSSGGPHLHFEIRNTANEHPLDPLNQGFSVEDHHAPLLERLVLIPISADARCNGKRENVMLPTTRSGVGQYRVSGNRSIQLTGTWGFAVQTVDQQDGGSNRNGTVMLKMWLDDSLRYVHDIDEFSFSETRYMNSLITYDQYKCCRWRGTKLYVEPNNQLSFVQGNPAGYEFEAVGKHTIRIEAEDRSGNRSVLMYSFGTQEPAQRDSAVEDPVVLQNKPWLVHHEAHRIAVSDARCIIPAGVLYTDTYFPKGQAAYDNTFYTPLYRFGHQEIPAHTYFTLDLPLAAIPKGLRAEQLCFVEVEESGRQEWWPGEWKSGRFTGRSREFGRYAIGADTVAPVIDPVNIYARKNMSRNESLMVRIKDDFSGIDAIKGTIDGQWVLMEWDPKTRRLWYTFDERCPAGEHTFALEVTDNCGNTAEYVVFFTR